MTGLPPAEKPPTQSRWTIWGEAWLPYCLLFALQDFRLAGAVRQVARSCLVSRALGHRGRPGDPLPPPSGV